MSEDVDDSPPIALFLSGESFFRSARYLRKGSDAHELKLRFDMPIYYLFTHALELILKSFLRSKGFSDSKLRSRQFGHSLQSLWDACMANGLADQWAEYMFTGQAVALLDPFATEFEFRYVKVGFKNLPTLEAVEEAVSDLIAIVRPYCEATIVGSIVDQK